jgi:hypothetical protein
VRGRLARRVRERGPGKPTGRNTSRAPRADLTSSCPKSAPRPRRPNCSPPRSLKAPWPPWPNAPPMDSMSSSPRSATVLPPARWPVSTRLAARGGQAALGPLRPHRQVHPDHLPPQARPRGPERGRRPGDRFRGVAVHDAWAPYDSYIDVKHQLCCAHAQRELVAVTDAAGPDVDWCWATQTHDALVTMQKLVADAIATGADTVDPHTQPRRSTSTAARSRSASPPPQPAATR